MQRIYSIILLLAAGLMTAPGAQATTGDASAFTNTAGMTFVRIPAGKFQIGSPKDEPYRDTGETLHLVTISKPFYLQTTEVTFKQWRTVMGLKWFGLFDRHRGADNLPVTKVCHHDIKSFLEKLNAMGNGRYRLPTEAEWEYAARAGTTSAYSWGDRISCGRAMYANHNVGKNDCSGFSAARNVPRDGPAPVKSYPPNAWGLYDMHGNVWEWVSDWFSAYSSEHQTDPQGPASGVARVRRGGSWSSSGDALRSANRAYGHPAGRLRTTGFRVVLEIDE